MTGMSKTATNKNKNTLKAGTCITFYSCQILKLVVFLIYFLWPWNIQSYLKKKKTLDII